MGSEVGSETAHIPAPSAAASAIPAPRTGSARRSRFAPSWRRPRRHTLGEAPRLRQLMGVCGWAAVLGGIGLVIGLRGHIGILAGDDVPSWYEPSLITVGFVGILLTVGAFLTVSYRRAPWIFLCSSSVALIVAMSLTSTAF